MASSLGPLAVLSAVVAIAPASVQTDKGWELRVTSRAGPTERTCFETAAPGKGSYFLAGPAKFEEETEWKFQAIFDGLGMVNRFELRPKDHPTKMCYSSAWMNTGTYKEYVHNPKVPPRGVIFEDTIPPRKSCFLGMCDYKAPNDNNWVNMLMVGEKAYWLSDTVAMVEMDLETLNCTGLKTWADDTTVFGLTKPKWIRDWHIAAGGSAHPLVRPGTSTVVELLVESPMMMGHYYVDVYTYDASVGGPQNRVPIASIKTEGSQYFHSYGVTANYVVLPFNLMGANVGPGHPPILKGNFLSHWKGVYVVDSKGGIQLFDDMDPFYHVHIANTFENASGVTMDLAVYRDIPFARMSVIDIKTALNKTARDVSQPRGQMHRMHFDVNTKKTAVEKLTDNNKDYDFLKINPSKNGLPYCIYYAVEWFHDGASYASMAVMKHDICKGTKLFWSQPDTYINEPFFIANEHRGSHMSTEDDGTVIFTANDGQKGKAIFVTLNAHTFEEIERIELPNHIPFTAHGQFIPATPDIVVV